MFYDLPTVVNFSRSCLFYSLCRQGHNGRHRCFSLLVPRIWGAILCLLGLTTSTGSLQGEGSRESSSAVADLGTRPRGIDWPQFLGPNTDNKSPETGIRTDWNAGKLPVVWTRPLVESYGMGAVARGRYYQFDRHVDRDGDIPSGRGVLESLHAETGDLLWTFSYTYEYRDTYNYNRGPRTTPLVDDDRIYLYGVDGMLLCVNAVDGSEVWRVDTVREFGVVQNFFGVGSNPVIYDDKILVMVGGSPEKDRSVAPGRLDLVSGNGSGIVAFDKRTGKVLYKLSDELASYASLKIAHSSDRPWCFAWMRGGLLTFDPRSGRLDSFFPWRAEILESVNASVPVVWDDQVFLSETYGPGSVLLRYSPQQIAIVWQDAEKQRRKAMQTHWNTAIYHQGYLYGSSGRHEGNAELRCIDANDGRVRWTEPGLLRSSLLYVDGHLVCLSEDGTLRLIRATPERYTLVTSVDLRDRAKRPLLTPPAWSAPVLSHGLLYVRGNDRLVCLELIPHEG